MKDLTQVSALLENLISEEVKRCTATLEEEKNRAQALENDYSDYIRFIVKEYNLDLDAQIQKVTKDYEHSEYCDAMAGRYSASSETFDLSCVLARWKTIKKICEKG